MLLALVLALVLGVTACGASGPAAPKAGTTTPPSASARGTSQRPSRAPEPRVRGNRLVDARTGRTWVPRGVDWSSFEYACAQGWGYSALDTLGDDGATKQAAALAAWRVNVVRIPLNEDCWLGTRGAPVSEAGVPRTAAGYRAAVAGFVAALRARGIVAVLDLQSRKRADADEFGNLAMPDAQSIPFWTSLATKFRDDPSVMFDAFNEPYSRYDAAGHLVLRLTWDCWRDGGCQAPTVDDRTPVEPQTYSAVGMATLVRTIRATGARQPILLGGLDYANDLDGWLAHAPDDDQLVAAVHLYDFKPCQESCWSDTLATVARRVPVLAAELGADQPTGGFVSDYLRFADAHGLGALFWAWGNDPADPMALVDGLVGHPTDYGRLAQQWLAQGRAVATPDGPGSTSLRPAP